MSASLGLASNPCQAGTSTLALPGVGFGVRRYRTMGKIGGKWWALELVKAQAMDRYFSLKQRRHDREFLRRGRWPR